MNVQYANIPILSAYLMDGNGRTVGNVGNVFRPHEFDLGIQSIPRISLPSRIAMC